MIQASDLLLNRLALIVYALLLSFTLIVTWLRVRRSARAVTFGWLLLSFFLTLLAITFFTGVIGSVLFGFLISFGSTLSKGDLGIAGFLLILGPALCGLLSLLISIYPASLVCRLFWPPRTAAKNANPGE